MRPVTETIAQALTRAGCTVQEAVGLLPGRGTAELLLVGLMGYNFLMLCLDGERNGAILTPLEEKWVKGWGGVVMLAETPEQALNCIGKQIDKDQR